MLTATKTDIFSHSSGVHKGHLQYFFFLKKGIAKYSHSKKHWVGYLMQGWLSIQHLSNDIPKTQGLGQNLCKCRGSIYDLNEETLFPLPGEKTKQKNPSRLSKLKTPLHYDWKLYNSLKSSSSKYIPVYYRGSRQGSLNLFCNSIFMLF